MTLPFVGQVQDMGNRFASYLQALRDATPRLTRVGFARGGPAMIYTPPPEYNDYLNVVPMTMLPVPFAAAPLTLPDTGAAGVVKSSYQPEVISPDESWLLSAHGYFQGTGSTHA